MTVVHRFRAEEHDQAKCDMQEWKRTAQKTESPYNVMKDGEQSKMLLILIVNRQRAFGSWWWRWRTKWHYFWPSFLVPKMVGLFLSQLLSAV